jgi:hypothetical protein
VAIGFDQFIVAAQLGQRTIAHHGDPVGPFRSPEPVGDDDHGAALGQCGESRLGLAFGPGVDAGRGLVHDEDGRVREGSPGKAHQLALPGGQVRTSFAYVGFLSLREARYPVAQTELAHRIAGVVKGRARSAKGHIFQHRPPEEENF